jgi:putative tricarboxylic transport membrane protein
MLQGLTPGPGLFTDHMDLIIAIFIMTLVGTTLNLVVSKLLIIPVFSRLAMIEKRFLVAVLLPIMAIGIYSINLRGYDVLIMFLAGILGVLLRRINVPLSPMVVSVMVVPVLELQFKRANVLAQGDWLYYFSSPLCLTLYGVLVLLGIYAWRSR